MENTIFTGKTCIYLEIKFFFSVVSKKAKIWLEFISLKMLKYRLRKRFLDSLKFEKKNQVDFCA